MPGHGCVCSSVVLGNQEGPDGVSDQEAASSRGNTVWQGQDLPAWEVCGQDTQEELLGGFCGEYGTLGKTAFDTLLKLPMFKIIRVHLRHNW